MMTKSDRVYICSPLSASTTQETERNMHIAREYVREVMSELKCRVFAPHAWLPELLDDAIPAERKLAMEFDMKLLKTCSVVVICHPSVTAGVAKEIAEAQKIGTPIFVRPAPGKYHPARQIPEIGIDAGWEAWGL